jgi:hypothetical protein
MNRDEDNVSSEVRFPWMRSELQYAISALADEDFQRREWSRHSNSERNITYTFDMALHALLDDSVISDQGRAAVGAVLKDDEELHVMQDLVGAAQQVIQDIGLQGTFEDAISRPSWSAAVRAAQRATSVLGPPPRFPLPWPGLGRERGFGCARRTSGRRPSSSSGRIGSTRGTSIGTRQACICSWGSAATGSGAVQAAHAGGVRWPARPAAPPPDNSGGFDGLPNSIARHVACNQRRPG